MEDRRGVLLAVGTAFVGAGAALLALVKHRPWLTALLVIMIVIGVVALLGASISYGINWTRDWRSKRKSTEELNRQPAPPFTARWRYTTDGAEANSAMIAFQKGVNHPGYMRDPYDPASAKVVLAVLVPCDPLTEPPRTSDLVKAFLDLLSGPIVGKLASVITHVPGGVSWHSYASNGTLNNQAVLARSRDETELPVASALLNLNDASVHHQMFQDPQRAELVLRFEHLAKDGEDGPPLTLAEWQAWLLQALKLPDGFGHCLREEVHVATYADVPVQIGVWLEARHDLTSLVDAGDVEAPPGMGRARTFPLYVLGDPAGKEPRQAVVDALRGLCDHGLHVHGYEDELDRLRSENA